MQGIGAVQKHNLTHHNGEPQMSVATSTNERAITKKSKGDPISTDFMIRNKSKECFQNARELGSAWLVAKSFGLDTSKQDLTPEDVKAVITMANFVMSLTHNQLHEFASTMNTIKETTHSQARAKMLQPTSLTIPIQFPTRENDMIGVFTRGKNSTKQNLPHPQVHCDANHAHCLPSECIADFLAHNNKFPPKKKSHQVQSMFDSPTAKTICIKNNLHGCKTMLIHMCTLGS